MSLEKLIRIASPPTKPTETGSLKQWDHIQKRIGTVLPNDYKGYINRYGTGSFNNLIIPYNPFTQIESINLIQVLDAHHQADCKILRMAGTTWSAVHPFKFFPAIGGVLPWGTTTHFGEIFLWQVSGPPDSWATITYNLHNGEYEVWKFPFATFLVKLFLKEIESVIFPGNFPTKPGNIHFIPGATEDSRKGQLDLFGN
jgi:hypothetical protein